MKDKNTESDKQKTSPFQKAKEELDAYNREHGTNYSYGYYITNIWVKHQKDK